jgi:hypothetical protein
MKKCKNCKVTAETSKSAWYARLIPNRKTRHKWVKQFLQSVKVEISFGSMFKWIFCIMVWYTIFPNSGQWFIDVLKQVGPFL